MSGSYESVKSAITHRVMRSHPDLLIRYGLGAVVQAIDDKASQFHDWQLDEIGSSDVSCWVMDIEKDLERQQVKP